MKRRKNISRKEKRRTLKKKTPIYKKKSFWIFVFGFIVGASAVYFFIYSDIFQIKEIKISGNQKVSNQALENSIEPFLGKKIIRETKSLFLVNIKDLERKIVEQFPQIEAANLSRQFPGTLILEAKERRGILIFCRLTEVLDSDDCFSVDKQGVVFEKTDEKDGMVIYFAKDKIVLGESVIEEEKAVSILEIYRGLKENKTFWADKFFLFEDRFAVLTNNGFEIYFNLEDNIAEQIFNLDLVLKEEISPQEARKLEYIDLRFNNRIYYK